MAKFKIPEILYEPKFASALERRYCLTTVARAEYNSTRAWFLLGAGFWAIAALVAYYRDVDISVKNILLPLGAVLFAIQLGGFFWFKPRRAYRLFQLAMIIASQLIFYGLARLDMMDGEGSRVLAGLWIMGTTVGISLLAFRNWIHITVMVLYLGLLAVGLRGYPDPELGWALALVLVVSSSNAQIFFHRSLKREGIKSFRSQSVYTPKQVLMHAVRSGRTIADVFGPEKRKCVCICSDWRNFQNFAAEVDAGELGRVLESYYTLQLQLLDKAFPEGNYFLDWIADELFAVGFVTETADDRAVAKSALLYAIECLQARPQFYAAHQAPSGLDVGIAFGIATVGMLGPVGNKKATALGSVAGAARRLQTVGKELRKTHGAEDRVVLHPLMRDLLPQEIIVERIAFPREVAIKDLTVTSVLVATTASHVAERIVA